MIVVKVVKVNVVVVNAVTTAVVVVILAAVAAMATSAVAVVAAVVAVAASAAVAVAVMRALLFVVGETDGYGVVADGIVHCVPVVVLATLSAIPSTFGTFGMVLASFLVCV